MRIEHREDGSIDAYVRQSWIKEVTTCPERGRQGIVRGDWNIANELTAIGTAVHAGAERHLTEGTDAIGVYDAAMVKWREILEQPMRWVKFNQHESEKQIAKLCDAWWTDLRPQVEGRTEEAEWNFEFLLDEFTGFFPGLFGDLDYRTVRVHGKGTVDVVAQDELWDWKTASRRYNAREYQESDIQSAMYAAAAVAAGRLQWPVIFNFGVMVRGGGTQIVTVNRDQSHLGWLRHKVRPLVRQALILGTETEWPVNETGYLCNSTWCPFWSVCRGAFTSAEAA